MDQALASPVASYARNPAAPRTSSFWLPSEGQSQTVAPPRDGSAPRSGPHSEPVHIAPRPSSPALCQSRHKGLSAGFLLRLRYRNIRPLTEGLLLRRFHKAKHARLRMSAKHGLTVVVPKGFDQSRIPGILHRKREWLTKVGERFEDHRKFLS